MSSKIIDGKTIAKELLAEQKDKLRLFLANNKLDDSQLPHLAVILVGNNPASHTYVNSKMLQAKKNGFNITLYKLKETTKEQDIANLIVSLNNNNKIHAILLQLPLPQHLNSKRLCQMILPKKDVDGFCYENIGKLMNYEYSVEKEPDFFVPCTPLGISYLLSAIGLNDLSGYHAVVVGRSQIVGRPVSALLLAQNATVTITHSKTKNLKKICQTADILITAIGKPKLITKDYIKPGAIVIDVGINRINEAEKSLLCGDVDFDEAKEIAAYITPVPKGVGPMTIACLMQNTLKAYFAAKNEEKKV